MGFHTDLPAFPWDALTPYARRAAAHPQGLVDLSVGTPVDPTPAVVARALAAAANSPGYPPTYGTAELREAIAAYYARERHVPGLDPAGVLPTIGSKEIVATLPSWLGLGAGDTVVIPEIAYPTYDIGARLAGASPIAPQDPTNVPDDARVRLVWLNSPANPTGEVLGVDELARIVAWARERGAIVASDECYAALPWQVADVPSLLDPRVTGGDLTGLLALYSLSKESNLAGYRAAWIAGDPALIGRLLELRKHAGEIVPGPVQAAMVAALSDRSHVAEQRERYRRRRETLTAALTAAGFRIDGSRAGLYLWATKGEDSWHTVGELAELGILVAPGAFYGSGSPPRHVRVALTATDEHVAAAATRLAGP